MPDIAKMLWPKSVAVVGASSDTQGLRGRILEIILGHPFAGKLYPVSRSASNVQGLKAYASVDTLPEPADLAVLIIPAQYISDELERCGRAGIKSAVILSSGFAEEPGESGLRMQQRSAALARRPAHRHRRARGGRRAYRALARRHRRAHARGIGMNRSCAKKNVIFSPKGEKIS